MKTVTYVGDPAHDGDGPKVIKVKGKSFVKGEATEVSDGLNEFLRGHNHFEAEGGPRVENMAKGDDRFAEDADPVVEEEAPAEEVVEEETTRGRRRR